MSDEQQLPYQPGEETQSSGMTSTALVNTMQELLAGTELRIREHLETELKKSQVETARVVDVIIEHKLQVLSDDLRGQIRTVVMRQDNLNERVGRFEGRFEQMFKERDEDRVAVAALKTQLTEALELGSAVLMDSPTVRARARKWIKEELQPYVRVIIFVVVIVNFLFFLLGLYLVRGA